jgi:hypothetical protein
MKFSLSAKSYKQIKENDSKNNNETPVMMIKKKYIQHNNDNE